MVYKLDGNWKKGRAFDLHTLASTYLGPDGWDTSRSEMGELVYQLKYKGDKSAVAKIIELLKAIGGIEKFDFIIPVPSSKVRSFQPVDAIAVALGTQRSVPVLTGFLEKAFGGAELKGVDDPDKRAELLKDKIKVSRSTNIVRKNVLLVDDLYRSGTTLSACCSILYEHAGVESVCVLTMTKTRSKV